MPIPVSCQCGKEYRVRDEFAGKSLNCPYCGTLVRVATVSTLPRPEPADPAITPPKPRTPSPALARRKAKWATPVFCIAVLAVACAAGYYHFFGGRTDSPPLTAQIPGIPLEKMSGKLVCPIGTLANVEYPQSVVRESAGSVKYKGGMGVEIGFSNQTYSASPLERPVWLVFRAGETAGTEIFIDNEEYEIKIGDSEIVCLCLGSDITEKESAIALDNMAFSHKGSRGYRRLLFIMPSNAAAVTIQYTPKSGTPSSVIVQSGTPSSVIVQMPPKSRI